MKAALVPSVVWRLGLHRESSLKPSVLSYTGALSRQSLPLI